MIKRHAGARIKTMMSASTSNETIKSEIVRLAANLTNAAQGERQAYSGASSPVFLACAHN